jgi:hypothetical protein
VSKYCIIYLGNGILCIFRQLLKYLCFSYSFLDGLRKYVDLIPPHKNTLEMMAQVSRL